MFPSKLSAALEESYIPSVDGLRALAVSLVVLYHFGLPIDGGLGVLIFFVLSGFLITWLLLKEERKWADISLKSFYIRRSLRIFPAFYVFWFLVVIVLGAARGKEVDWMHALTSFFYVGNYYQGLTGQWKTALFHTWSLAIEEQFYLIWPIVFIALKNNERRARVLAIAIPCVWVYRLLLFRLGVDEGYMYTALDTRADHLMIGCLTAVMMFTKSGSKIWQAICAKSWSLWVTLGLLALSSLAFLKFGTSYRDTLGFIIQPILVVALLVQAISFRPVWLNVGPVRYVGRISYSVYLYHMLGISFSEHFLQSLPLPLRVLQAALCVLVLATGSYYFIERPFLSLKDKLGKRPALLLTTCSIE